MIQITPQIYKTYFDDGSVRERWISYAIFKDEVLVGYSRCFCKAQAAAELFRRCMR